MILSFEKYIVSFVIALGLALTACGATPSDQSSTSIPNLEIAVTDTSSLSPDDFRLLERSLHGASREVNKLKIPDAIYQLDESSARIFFERYFTVQRMTAALMVNLWYPVHHWGANQPNLQRAIAPVLLTKIEMFFAQCHDPRALNAAFASDPGLHDHVFYMLNFLALLADSKHLDDPSKTMMYQRLLSILDTSRLGQQSCRRIDKSTFPYVNSVKTQLLMTCFAFANSTADCTRLAHHLALSGDHKMLLDNHGILVLDNGGFDTGQLRAINAYVNSVPPQLRISTVITCFDLLIDPIRNGRVSVHDLRCNRAFNLFDIKVGAAVENQFPQDWRAVTSDLFVTVLTHEYNHQVDAIFLAATASLAAYKGRILKLAGSDHNNFLRSMFDDGFFENNPQELVASLANMYFCSSQNVFDLALTRAAAGNYNPINQFNLMASLYSDTDQTFFYEIPKNGRTLVTEYPIKKDHGLITSLTLGHIEYTFSYVNGLIAGIDVQTR